MQHVADGIMHAYLDGALDALADAGELPGGVTGADVRAHFDACADCRARLDDARAVKERAGLILDDAGRDVVDVPPFDVIGGRPQPRRRQTWLPLAWAASLVLAIGAGWWASDIARDERVTVAGEMTARAPSTAGAPVDGGGTDGAPAESERAANAPVTDAAADVPVTDVPVSDAPVTVAVPTTPAVASSSMADMAVAPRVGGAAGRAASDVAGDAAVAQAARTEAESAGSGSGAAADAAAHPDPAAFRAQLAAARADTSAWRRIDGGAGGAVGERRAVFVVAGAGAVVYDATAPTIGLGELVRARQWLETGEQIEVVTARPQRLELSEIVVAGAVDPAAAQRLAAPPADARSLAARAPTAPLREAAASADAADGRARVDVVSSELLGDGLAEVTVWLPDEGIWVSIRGVLPAAELTELARRLVRAGR